MLFPALIHFIRPRYCVCVVDLLINGLHISNTHAGGGGMAVPISHHYTRKDESQSKENCPVVGVQWMVATIKDREQLKIESSLTACLFQ